MYPIIIFGKEDNEIEGFNLDSPKDTNEEYNNVFRLKIKMKDLISKSNSPLKEILQEILDLEKEFIFSKNDEKYKKCANVLYYCVNACENPSYNSINNLLECADFFYIDHKKDFNQKLCACLVVLSIILLWSLFFIKTKINFYENSFFLNLLNGHLLIGYSLVASSISFYLFNKKPYEINLINKLCNELKTTNNI